MLYIAFIVIISLNYSKEDQCNAIKCAPGVLELNKCILSNGAISSLKECNEGYYCNIKSENPKDEAVCEDNQLRPKIKRYEELPCENNEDCYLKKCDNKKCIGNTSQIYNCTNPNQCVYGKSCITQPAGDYCFPFKKEKESCLRDTDCELMHGCLNGICIKYYSLDNNAEVTDPSSSNYYSYCKSGYSLNGQCTSMYLINPYQPCDKIENKCIYRLDNGTDITLEERCKCGYNGEGESYCELGSKNYNYTLYLTALQEYYRREEKCHGDERDKIPCIKDELSKSEEDKAIIGKLISKKLWATRSYQMYNAEHCALKIYYPDYNAEYDEKEPLPEEISCPNYTCGDKDTLDKNSINTCAEVLFKSYKSINVTLYDTCKNNHICPIDHSDPLFYETQAIQCKEVTKAKKRYPGEQCDTNSDCIIYNSCDNSRCEGKGNSCESNSDCLVGEFCNHGKCKAQLSLGDLCTSPYECQNHHYCFDGKCQDVLFTKADNTPLPNGPNGAEYPSPEKVCQYNYQHENKCASLRSTKPLPPYEDYLKCTPFSKCYYQPSVNEQAVVMMDCSCNYNNEGRQYCPHDHYQDPIMLKRYLKALKASYNNKCHTIKRYDCDLLDEGTVNEIKMYQNHVDKGHLFYKSALCSEKVMKAEYNHIATLLLLIGFLMIL